MITARQTLKYMTLPDILPRVKELKLNLKWFAYLMALIFTSTRILPHGHLYSMPSEQGKFGVADVMFEAARNLKGGRRHLDQYLIYVSFAIGLLLLIGQFALLFFILATSTAEAAIPWTGMFSTPVRTNDLALMMLDKVFEIPNMWGSKYNPATIADVSLFGKGLHNIFYFYNYGMLMVAGLIVVYYFFVVVAETMQTGTPFGQRFQEIFVPIRICLAILLLLPLGYGYSAGQLLVFKLADWGSGFATNGWLMFNKKAASNPMGLEAQQLLVSPKGQDVDSMIRFYALVHSCRAIYMKQYGVEILPYLIDPTSKNSMSGTGSYDDALQYYDRTNIRITFGEKNAAYTAYAGTIKPYCGTIDLPTANYDIEAARIIQETYWDFMKILWTSPDLTAFGNHLADNFTARGTETSTATGWTNTSTDPDAAFYANVKTKMQTAYNGQFNQARNAIRSLPESQMIINEELLNRGWGGAGIWFNQIAQYNGAVVTASTTIPNPSAYPKVMQYLLSQKKTTNHGLRNMTQFNPGFSNGAPLKDMMSGGALDDPAKDAQIASFLNTIYDKMSVDDTFSDGTQIHDDNVIANMFNMIFGTYGLFELRGNDEIHPLAKMSALGKSIIDRAIMYMTGAMIMGGLSSLGAVLDSNMGLQAGGSFQQAFSGIGSMFSSFALVGLTVGIVLYYVIPFLPFLYFFFAVGRWVKSVFEAVVGIPLWALAHLRIDGEGIPGPAAANGYYLLLEIMLRPILVIFGLMAAVSTFSALAIMLDTIFDLVIQNVTGYTPMDQTGAMSWKGVEFRRGHIDQFFYTVMYAVILYMMALSCFKLIDLIPNSVLRFIGTQVSEFGDKLNLESDIINTAGIGTFRMAGDAGQASVHAGEAIGRGVTAPIGISQDIQAMAQRMMPAQPKGPAD